MEHDRKIFGDEKFGQVDTIFCILHVLNVLLRKVQCHLPTETTASPTDRNYSVTYRQKLQRHLPTETSVTYQQKLQRHLPTETSVTYQQKLQCHLPTKARRSPQQPGKMLTSKNKLQP